jgi:SSS family solute:Na+ symporter
VIVVYLAGMIALGFWLSRRQKTEDEYFLGSRSMPWFAVGVSVIASLLSSLTYLSEPGEVWNSGVTHVFGKMLAIPFEMIIVWLFCIPFMMRFRFTSAYEYLELRFGPGTRALGVALFIAMVVLWMGFVVLATSRALATVSGMDLFVIITTIGVVATIYTMLGGLRAVIWTDVIQVALLIGGGLFVIGFVMVTTRTWVPQWYEAAALHLTQIKQPETLPWFSFDPTVRATVVTVAVNMCIWHVCTHTANQMTVQRYFSTSDMRAARRSFVTGSLFGVGLNLMLVVVGLAVVYYYVGQDEPLEYRTATTTVSKGESESADRLDPENRQDRDLIFPTFAVHRLPPGFGGAILAALLAAAMSSIDSGINSIATVVSVELRKRESVGARKDVDSKEQSNHVARAQWMTLAAGAFITVAAYSLNFLPDEWGIVDAMPRTFNAITGPLGGLFLVGMFIPAAGGRAAVAATICGLLTSISLGYFKQICEQLQNLGLLEQVPPSLSFTWIMPSALLVTLLSAAIFSQLDYGPRRKLAGLTWYTRHDPPPKT